MGTYLAAIALTVDVFDRTGSGAWVSALLIADFLPIIVIGFLFAPLVDRLSRKRLLIVSDLVRVAIFCVLPFAGSATAIVVLAGLAGIATGFFRPAVYAGLPNLVDDEELSNATSLLQTGDNLTWMVGPVVGGILIAISRPGSRLLAERADVPLLRCAARPDPGREDAGGQGREPWSLA